MAAAPVSGFHPSLLFRKATWQAWMAHESFPLPIVRDLVGYRRETFRADALAAATVTLVSIPQAIGFALIAGLPPSMVVTCLIVGGFFSALFMSSRHMVFGPTNSISIILAVTIHQALESSLGPAEITVVLAALIGIVQLSAGLLKFGELTNYISRSVVIAYSSGIGILLALGQIPNLFGIDKIRGDGTWLALLHAAQGLIGGDPARILPEVALAAVTLLLFYLIRRVRPRWPDALLTLIILAAATAFLRLDALGIRTLGSESGIVGELPNFSGLPLSLRDLTAVGSLTSAAFAIALLGMLEGISIAKSLAGRSGQRLNANQDLVGMGVGNLLCSTFGAMPGSASFARSAVNFQAGARTQVASLLGSGLVLLALLFLLRFLNYLPIAALAAHLFRLGWSMIQWDQIRIAVRSTRSDAAVFAATLAACLLLPLDTAIYIGIAVSLALFLRKAATPKLVEYAFNDSGQLAALEADEKRANDRISIIHVEGDLFFGAADLFQDQVRRIAEDKDIEVFILRMKNARHLDATTVFALEALLDYLRSTKRYLLVSGIEADAAKVLKDSGLLRKIGPENVFPAEANPTLATKRALLRACHLLQIESGSFRIFYDRGRDTSANTPRATTASSPLYEI